MIMPTLLYYVIEFDPPTVRQSYVAEFVGVGVVVVLVGCIGLDWVVLGWEGMSCQVTGIVCLWLCLDLWRCVYLCLCLSLFLYMCLSLSLFSLSS